MSKHSELVSVVIPTYNRAYILKKTVDSILQSTYKNIEVIIVDDGSADDTRALLKTFDDPRIRGIFHETNKGLSAARNTGIENSRGEFISLCDSDDRFLPEKIEKNVEKLKSLPLKYGMIVSNHYDLFPAGERRIGILGTDPRRIHPMPSTWMIRREVIRNIGSFDERILVSEDIEFLDRLNSFGYKFYFMEEPLLLKFVSPDHFFVDKTKLLKKRKLSADNVKGEGRLYALMLFIYAKDLWKCGHKAEARENFLKAFLNYPRLKYLSRYVRCFLKPNKGVEWVDPSDPDSQK